MAAVAELRERLAERYPNALPVSYRTTQVVATGIGKLDGLLPNGGLPRGRLTVWRPGGGATAVLRSTCRSAVERGERTAWIDGNGRVTGDFWPEGPLLLRPSGEKESVECAEELSRCGGFGLVVLVSGDVKGTLAIRLGRAVRAGGGALVIISADTEQAQLRMESRFVVPDWHWSVDPFGDAGELKAVSIRVHAWSLGWSGQTELRCVVLGHDQRMGVESQLVDRRGAKRKSSWSRTRPIHPPSPSPGPSPYSLDST
jgi:hypothetical protein